jgi:uncharacterized protein with HEPN domain
MKEDSLLLNDIIKAASLIREFIGTMDFTAFESDEKTSSAVIRQFEIIGEAAKNVSNEVINQNPDIPWKEMAGMRDRLIHGYAGVDLKLVWDTSANRIPELKESIQKIINSL